MAQRVQAAVEAELTHRLATSGIARAFQIGGAQPSLRGAEVRLSADRNLSHLGAQIADAVYAVLTESTTEEPTHRGQFIHQP